jgi:hypothetical protein
MTTKTKKLSPRKARTENPLYWTASHQKILKRGELLVYKHHVFIANDQQGCTIDARTFEALIDWYNREQAVRGAK